jgi:hypothetical protein
MGWNVTYHPLKENEITECYFAVLENPTLEQGVIQQYALDERSAQRLSEVYQVARESRNEPFNKSHGFFLAAVAGILRKYWYLCDAAFSFMVKSNSQFETYVTPWTALVPQQYQRGHFDCGITESYCSGFYLNLAGLQKLQIAYAGDARIWAIVEDTFSHGRLAVFWKAVDYAIEHQMGLLEATEIIEPDLHNPHNTHCFSTLLNCEKESLLLYQETVP